MRPRLILAAFLVFAVASPAARAAGDAAPRDTSPGEVSAEVSAPDSAAFSQEAPPASDPPGNVLRILSGGPIDVLSAEPATVPVGTRWRGHRASLARGALPATFTSLSVAGRRVTDCIQDGLDLVSSFGASPGVFVTPSGPDMSLWPVYAAALPRAHAPGGASRTVVEMRPGRRPPRLPYARLTMGGGDLGWQAAAVEFGRRYRDGRVGMSGFFETRAGEAPLTGGSYNIEVAGGRLLLPIAGQWLFEASMRSTDLNRGLPAAYSGPDSTDTRYTGHDTSLSATDGRSRVALFHVATRLDVRPPSGEAGTITSWRDGAAARIEWDEGPVDAVDVAVASRRLRGSLLRDGATEFEAECDASRSFVLDGRWLLSLSGGWSQLADRGFPTGAVSASGLRSPLWALSLSAHGRHPTAQERLLTPVEIQEGTGTAEIAGSRNVGTERAVVLAGDWHVLLPEGRLKARAEVARILDPVALRPAGEGKVSPTNLADETTVAISLWADLGDTSRAGARLGADLVALEEGGAVLSRAPVPVASLTASAWVERNLLRGGYLETRWEISVAHETGRSRGPWEGLLDDGATSVSASVSARAGSARLYARVEDVLDARSPYLPGLPGAGRVLTAGFSWSFVD
jgi:hypothetical protein